MGKNARTFRQDIMRGEGKKYTRPKNLTWVKGETDKNLDPTSAKNLRGGRKAQHSSTPPHGPRDTRAANGTLEYEESNGTSIFDPVLCELVYRWFSPPGGSVLDPFAGGSVRGIVASVLGRRYTGLDLSARQIAYNEVQAEEICGKKYPRPKWIAADSIGIRSEAPGEYDLVFSCPPYADLEVYSDDPRDLSTMPYKDFVLVYRQIIADSLSMLRPNRFAVFVVGDVRDPKGNYRGFVGDTVRAFEDAGAHLYNDAVLVTAVGSLSIRAGRQFASARKLGKTHQNVLVFLKGSAKVAVAELGEVEISRDALGISPAAEEARGDGTSRA